MEWAVMLFMASQAYGAAGSELLGTYETKVECETISAQLSKEADSPHRGSTFKLGSKTTPDLEVHLYYTCAPVPKAYFFE